MLAYYNITAFVTLYIIELFYSDGYDYVKFLLCANATGVKSKVRRARINYSRKGSPYFMHNGERIYLDNCIKIN